MENRSASVAPQHALKARPQLRRAEPKASDTGYRELVETVVVVLVLLLKTFTAEAFVIPTGSMATTLWGYQKYVDCPKCRFHFPVNCSDEAEAKSGHSFPVIGCTCPNCRYTINFLD